MNRRQKMPCYAPAMYVVTAPVLTIIHHKARLVEGAWVFGALTFALLLVRAPASNWVPMLLIALLLAGLHWRWKSMSNMARDVWVRDYVLTEPVDLAWMEWIKDLEPRIDLMLEKHRPDGRYTVRDFQKAFWRHAFYKNDLQKRSPYYGDWEQCTDDLEDRRDRERTALRLMRRRKSGT